MVCYAVFSESATIGHVLVKEFVRNLGLKDQLRLVITGLSSVFEFSNL
jgi:hypothetical protein